MGRSAPLLNWAGRLACFFFFFFLHTHNNVYVFKLLTKLITLDLNLTLKCDVFCCQSARALSLPLHKHVSQVVAMETPKPLMLWCELARVR